MRIRLNKSRMTWTLVALFVSGAFLLSAAPGGGGKGSSGGGERGKSASANRGGKAGKAGKTVETQLERHPKLSAKLAELLPPDTDLPTAAAGFRNLGQFVAAVHVSYNLGLNFSELRTEMVDHGLSLGQAIHLLRPTVDADEEAAKAEEEADEDLAQS